MLANNYSEMTLKKNKILLGAAILLCLAVTIFAAGCVNTQEQEPVTITVFAAASLTDALTEIGDDFENEYPYITVDYNFAGSSTLKTQILEGADVDMYISASNKQFTPVVDAGLISEKKTLLYNKLAIAVPTANPANITDLGDMARSGVGLVIGDSAVPFGEYTRTIVASYDADHAGYSDAFYKNVLTETDAVTKIKFYLTNGDADASIVYKSAVVGDDLNEITLIDIPDQYNVIAEYPYGILSDCDKVDTVKLFESYLTGTEGSTVLKSYGFDPATA